VKRISLCVLITAVSLNGVVAQTPPDTTSAPPPFFTYRDALIFGGFAAGTIVFARFDTRLAEYLQTQRANESQFVHDAAAGFRFMGNPAPLIIGVGMYGAGRLGHWQRVEKLGLHGLESIVLSTGITHSVKMIAGRARPYVAEDKDPDDFKVGRGFKGHDYQSFPSGHTSTAFAVAATVTSEARQWWPGSTIFVGPIMYGGATMVGLSRMYHDAHWASDVVAGAAIGTFSGIKVVTYNYRHPKNKLARVLLSADVVPTGDGTFLTWTVRAPR